MSVKLLGMPRMGVATVLDACPTPTSASDSDSDTPSITSVNLLSDTQSLPDQCYLFLNEKRFPKEEEERIKLLRRFHAPDFLSCKNCVEHNGYFGCRATYDDVGEKLLGYTTWFRCLVKRVLSDEEAAQSENSKGYLWHEMGFFTHWEKEPRRHEFLCVDTPEELQAGLKATIRKEPPNPDDPFAMFTPVIDQIIKLQDNAVWRCRNPVRDIEKRRQNQGVNAISFTDMHEISRHAVHISEVLQVTADTLENLLRQKKALYDRGDLSGRLKRNYREQAVEYLSFQAQMIRSLKLRNDSNYERLKGEIQVAYNTIAQQDNAVMKTIALLTMVFLPATFTSAFFSTTFFSFGDDMVWRASRKIWIYVLVTAVATIPLPVMWLWWAGVLPRWWADSFLGRRWAQWKKKQQTGDVENGRPNLISSRTRTRT